MAWTLQQNAEAEAAIARGTNQSGMRAANERLVLTLVRQAGALAKSEIARATGLSAQTVSVIMRELERDGLLERREPVRGKIGQPTVPMSLSATGAYFLGLKVGRRSTDLVLIDFLGRPVAKRRRTYAWPTPDPVVAFVREALPQLIAEVPADRRHRIGGIGIAMPFHLWLWSGYVGAPGHEMDAWRERDLQAEIAALSDLPVTVQNDATAACGAELVFGTGERPRDFLYFYVGHFIGGGLVLNGQLLTGRTGNAAALGSMPVPGLGGVRQLISVASLAGLEAMTAAAGGDAAQLWETAEGWHLPEGVLDRWLGEAAGAIAQTVVAAAALVEVSAAMIDGWLPLEVRRALTERIAAALNATEHAGIELPALREGTVGSDARTLGAAAIPLAQRYLVDQGWVRPG